MTTDFDQSPTERELRDALAERARQIQPSSRLDAILAEGAAPEPTGFLGRRLTSLAIAAAAVVVAGTVWAVRPDPDSTLPVAPPSVTPTTTSSASPTGSPTPRVSPSPGSSPSAGQPSRTTTPPASTPPPTSATGALGIYRVGTNGGATNRPGLVREFWSPNLGRTTESQKVAAAVGEALRRSDLWQGVSVGEVSVTNDLIRLGLSDAGARASSAGQAELDVAALVWTAQGAIGRGDVPVRIAPEGGGRLLGQVGTGTNFTRASTPPNALCDLWIDSPSPGSSVRASESGKVRGQAVAWEANVEWELRSETSTVKEGFTTASIGAPSRGSFTVDLGRLQAGTYTFRVFTTSAEDGVRVLAEREVTFTVT